MYSWRRLTCTSKSASGSTRDAGRGRAHGAASSSLLARLTARHAAAEAGVVGERLELAQLLEVGEPARRRCALGDQRRQAAGWHSAGTAAG